MEKKNLERIQDLESVLKEGISYVNNEENKRKGIALKTILSSSEEFATEEYLKEMNESFGTLELSDMVPLMISLSERGLFKSRYLSKFLLLIEQGVLNPTKQIAEIISASKTLSLLIQQKVQEITEIEMKPIIPIFEGLLWDSVISFDNMNEFNDTIKSSIRNEYDDMARNYFNSILQRKISLNSKKLAIMNYIKQIQDKQDIFSPYKIEYTIYSEDYLGRKCDKEYRPYLKK